MQFFRNIHPFALPMLAALIALAALPAPAASGQTFSNAAAINVPTSGTNGIATLYPSPITVSGAPTSLAYVSITLSGFSHTNASDVTVLLVSPAGQKIVLMAFINSAQAVNNTLTFIPDGTATLPSGSSTSNVVSGIYACSVNSAPTSIPAPAPAGPYGTSLAPLIGTNANGTWNLYVLDTFAIRDSGSFTGGWSISFNTTLAQPTTTAFTYQGRLNRSDAPISGNANVRFTLCNNATVAASIAGISAPITRSFTGISDGLITTTLDFGSLMDTSQALWLNIEVESTVGSGSFITLTPRQPITATPQARVAQRAVYADTATNAINATNAANAANAASAGTANIASNLAPTSAIQLSTGTALAPNRLAFGPLGNLSGTAESTDAVYFQRINISTDNTDLRLYIGDNAGAAPGAGGDTFSIWSTNGTPTGGTEHFRFQSDGTALKPGGGSWTALSDPRAKHDIAPLTGTLDKLLHLRGYSFLYNDDRIASGLARPGTQIGLMADEVAIVFPDWVSTDSTGTRYVTERATTALMVEALRDLRAEKDRQMETLRSQNADLKARLEAIEAALSKLPQNNK